MTYLISQIWLCLLIAAVLGLVLGWWLRGRRCEQEIDDILSRQREALRLRDNTIDSLREVIDDGGPAANSQESVAAPPQPSQTTPVAAGGKPVVLLDSAPAAPDDLKRISGVGPKLEALLNSLGVYQFEQIARFSADDIAWVDQHLGSFKGRIARDDWVAQAQELGAANKQPFASSVGMRIIDPTR